MGGRRLLVGNEVFCLFATSHHLERKGKERVPHLPVIIYSFIHSEHSTIQDIFFSL